MIIAATVLRGIAIARGLATPQMSISAYSGVDHEIDPTVHVSGKQAGRINRWVYFSIVSTGFQTGRYKPRYKQWT